MEIVLTPYEQDKLLGWVAIISNEHGYSFSYGVIESLPFHQKALDLFDHLKDCNTITPQQIRWIVRQYGLLPVIADPTAEITEYPIFKKHIYQRIQDAKRLAVVSQHEHQ